MNRYVMFCCLLAFCGALFWASSLVTTASAGRDYPWPEDGKLTATNTGRQLHGVLRGGHDDDNAQLYELLKEVVRSKEQQPTILAVQQPGQEAPKVVPVQQVAPTPAPTPAPAAAPAVPAAGTLPVIGSVPPPADAPGALPALPVDQVALAAASAAASASGGIRIASSAPVALSNPIKIYGGTTQYDKDSNYVLG